MTDQEDGLQLFLTKAYKELREKFRALDLADTPFVLVAVSPDNLMIVRANLDPVALKLLSEDLGDAADDAATLPSNDEQVH